MYSESTKNTEVSALNIVLRWGCKTRKASGGALELMLKYKGNPDNVGVEEGVV